MHKDYIKKKQQEIKEDEDEEEDDDKDENSGDKDSLYRDCPVYGSKKKCFEEIFLINALKVIFEKISFWIYQFRQLLG